VAWQLYNIAQEALSNAIKHGKATRICLSLAQRNGRLVLRVDNDGVPFPTSYQPSNRMGLRIMNYRAHTIGGTFNIRPTATPELLSLANCLMPMEARDALPPQGKSLSPSHQAGRIV